MDILASTLFQFKNRVFLKLFIYGIYALQIFPRIDESLQVKITDNALSRDLFPMDYHCLGDNENRPVRWMSLESLVNKEFSSAGDVVSLAIFSKCYCLV